MLPMFAEPAEFVFEKGGYFAQLFRDRSISARVMRAGSTEWRVAYPDIDVTEATISLLPCTLGMANQRALAWETGRVGKTESTELPWLREYVEQHLGRHSVEDRLLARFLELFTPEVRGAVGYFPNQQWEVFAILGHFPQLEDLLSSDPALLYLLATICTDPSRLAPVLANGRLPRRRVFCELLGFPGTAAMVRILGKFKPCSCSPELRTALRLACGDSRRERLLRHLPGLSLLALRLLVSEWGEQWLADCVYFELAEAGPCDLLRRVAKILPILQAESREVLVHCLGGRVDLKSLDLESDCLEKARRAVEKEKKLALRAAEEVDRSARELMDNRPSHQPVAPYFPPPPFLPPPGCFAISDAAMLVDEALRQSNCLASYQEGILKGEVVIFRMLEPERGSFELVRGGETGAWSLGQAKAPGNRAIRADTRQGLVDWLRTSQEPRPSNRREGESKRGQRSIRSAQIELNLE